MYSQKLINQITLEACGELPDVLEYGACANADKMAVYFGN